MELSIPSRYLLPVLSIDKEKSFSGYRKTKVKTQLLKSIQEGSIDKALFWAIESSLSGSGLNLIESLCLFASTDINIVNPNLPNLLLQIYTSTNSIIVKNNNDKKNNKNFLLYNNQVVRNNIAQIVSVITVSPKSKLPKFPIWKKNSSLNPRLYKNRIKRNTFHYIQDIVKISDSNEIYIPLNEIDWAINYQGDVANATIHFLFWFSWLRQLEKRNPNKKFCSNRDIPEVPQACLGDISWAIWQIILRKLLEDNYGIGTKHSVGSLYKLFRINYTKSKKFTRSSYIIYAVMLIIGSVPPINFTTPIFFQLDKSILAILNINSLYYNIYTESRKINSNDNDAEKAIKKTEKIIYIPRINK